MSSAGFQKIFVHLVIFQNVLFTVHCSGQASEKWRLIKFHSTLYETQFIKNSCPYSTLAEWQSYAFITTSTFLLKSSTVFEPFTSKCRKMVRHTLKICLTILRHCEVKVNYLSVCFCSLSHHHTTNNKINHFCSSFFINCGKKPYPRRHFVHHVLVHDNNIVWYPNTPTR